MRIKWGSHTKDSTLIQKKNHVESIKFVLQFTHTWSSCFGLLKEFFHMITGWYPSVLLAFGNLLSTLLSHQPSNQPSEKLACSGATIRRFFSQNNNLCFDAFRCCRPLMTCRNCMSSYIPSLLSSLKNTLDGEFCNGRRKKGIVW